MKRLLMTFIIMQFSNIPIFADKNDIFSIIDKAIGESIEWKYINKINSYIMPTILRYYRENNLDSISVYIYFNAGTYRQKDVFNNIIEDKLLIELKDKFQNYDVNISVVYPFSIILVNNFNYELDEIQTIIKEIERDTYGIIIENIFQNSIYGYFEDNYFCNLPSERNRVKKLQHNNFNIFLEIIYKHFGMGNIISF